MRQEQFSQSIKNLLKIAEDFYFRIKKIEEKGTYYELEVNKLIKEIESLGDFPNLQHALDFYYRTSTNRDRIITGINAIRGVFHAYLKKHNADPRKQK